MRDVAAPAEGLLERLSPTTQGAAPPLDRRFRRHLQEHGISYLLLSAGCVVMLFPFIWMVSTSFKVDKDLFITPPQLIPQPFAPENYRTVLEAFPVGRFLFNSIVVAVASTALQLLSSATAAYAFARMRFWGRDALFVVYLATLMIPFQVVIVPLFVEMRYLGLVNTYPGLVLPTVASAFGTFLLRQWFMGLPVELEEAALIDGANQWTIFRRIVIPNSRPALAAFGIFAFMASWNSFLWPLVVSSSPDVMTLPVGLANLQGRYTTAWNLVMAGATISVIPILAVYIAAQKQVIRSVALSGIKG